MDIVIVLMAVLIWALLKRPEEATRNISLLSEYDLTL